VADVPSGLSLTPPQKIKREQNCRNVHCVGINCKEDFVFETLVRVSCSKRELVDKDIDGRLILKSA
jgi:hypothetical protein